MLNDASQNTWRVYGKGTIILYQNGQVDKFRALQEFVLKMPPHNFACLGRWIAIIDLCIIFSTSYVKGGSDRIVFFAIMLKNMHVPISIEPILPAQFCNNKINGISNAAQKGKNRSHGVWGVDRYDG